MDTYYGKHNSETRLRASRPGPEPCDKCAAAAIAEVEQERRYRLILARTEESAGGEAPINRLMGSRKVRDIVCRSFKEKKNTCSAICLKETARSYDPCRFPVRDGVR
jgi:hypothetical protein